MGRNGPVCYGLSADGIDRIYKRGKYAEKNLPRELNPYERLLVRWWFATSKVALLIPLGAVVGWLLYGWWM